MTNDDHYCSVNECGKECQPTGPAFCPDHWKALSRHTRKYLMSEFDTGEKHKWPDWFRRAYRETVATVANRLAP